LEVPVFKHVSSVGLLVTLLCPMGGAARATLITYTLTNVSVSANTNPIGLEINTALAVPGGLPYTFQLNDGQSTSPFNLFTISTPESSRDFDDIFVPRGISATLTFAPPLASGTVTGTTFAGLFDSDGHVIWAGPQTVTAGGVSYRITLTDAEFDFCNRDPGTVQAIITQLSSPPPTAHHPEPATLTSLGTGVACLLGYGWRRRKQSATAGG
jgi:hypothetical protein